MSAIITITNQKGGVGKTTTALNLGEALHSLGKRVLLIDADQQGNLTSSVLGNYGLLSEGYRAKLSLSELLHNAVAGLPCEPEQFIQDVAPLHIVTSSKLLAAANSILATSGDSDRILAKSIDAITHGGHDYDFVLIDCAPSLDLLIINSLTASDGVVILTEPAAFSVDGIVSVWETITRIQRTTNPKLKVEQIVINKFDVRKKDDHAHVAEIRDAFGEMVYPSPIPLLSEVKDSADAAKRGTMMGNRRSKAWPLYLELARVIDHEHA